jgi:PTH1 family peptidyl-tRNA hydrolase
MKYLIAGLGNIGAEYDFTRHNIGFSVVEYLAMKHEGVFKTEKLAQVCEIKIRGRQVVLIKPTTYMNLSGKALNYWLQAEKINIQNSLTITDDLSLPLGKIRLRQGGSPGGHNGLSNIMDSLHTAEFPRLRFGIGSNFPKGMQVQYVLSRWYKEEEEEVALQIEKSALAAETFIFAGLVQAMNQFNK